MDLMWRCFVSVRAMICMSGWLVSMLCRSMMVVCIPRVLRVRALRLGCVYGFPFGRGVGVGIVSLFSRGFCVQQCGGEGARSTRGGF